MYVKCLIQILAYSHCSVHFSYSLHHTCVHVCTEKKAEKNIKILVNVFMVINYYLFVFSNFTKMNEYSFFTSNKLLCVC